MLAIRAWLVCLGAAGLLAATLVGAEAASRVDSKAAAATLTAGLAEPLDCAVPTFDDKCEEFATVFDNEGSGGWNFINDMEISPSGDRAYFTGTSIGNLFDTVVAVYDTATAAPVTTIRWDAGTTNENPHASEISPDGKTLYVTGAVIGRRSETISNVVYGYYDYGTVAFDVETGQEQWSSFYEAPGLGLGAARASALSSDGDLLYVAGESPAPGSGLGNEARDFVTIAYTAEDEDHPEGIGQELWVSRFDGSRFDQVTDAVLSPDDRRLYVTGLANNDGITIAYDALTGEGLWAKRLSVGNRTFNGKILVSPDGRRVFVSGMRNEVGPGDGSALASVTAYDAASGSELWSDVTAAAVPNNPALRTGSWAHAVGMSRDGATVFHAGVSTVASSARENDLYVVALDAATGSRRWAKNHLAPGSSEQAWGLTTDPSGEQLFVVGYSSYPGQSCDALTLAYATDDGEQLWAARYPWLRQPVRPCSTGREVAVVGDAGRLVVAGQISDLTNNQNPFNFGVLGYDI